MKRGIKVHALTGPRGNCQSSKDVIDDINYYRTVVPGFLQWPLENMPHTGGGILFQFFLKRRLRHLVSILKPDVIHAHTPWLSARPAFDVAQEQGIRFVYEVRGFWEESSVAGNSRYKHGWRYRRIISNEDYLLQRTKHIVAISQGIKNNLAEKELGNKENIVVVPNGVDTTLFKPRSKNKKLIHEYNLNGKVVIGYISSLRKLEGIDTLIRALLHMNNNSIVMIVGDGPEKSKLSNLAKEIGLADRVIFTGRVPHDEVFDYYSIIDIFTIPRIDAKVCHIVTPLKPLEAMAMGKCVLASRVGGLTEMISDGETGLTFEPENDEDLAKKLNLLINNEDLRKSLGQTAVEFVKKERNWDTLCKRYFDVYTR